MILKQGDTYEDGEEEVTELEDPPKKSKLWLVLGIVGAFIAVVLIIIFALKFKDGADDPDVPEDPDIIVGSEGDIGVVDESYWDTITPAFSYTDEEKASLRAWGYTGDEIEEHEDLETPASDLVAQSKEAQEEARAALSNPESPEYQELLNKTWIGQEELSLPEYQQGVTEGSIAYNTFTYNADYEKIPAHGHNLFLKVYLEDGTYVFMECPVLRYMQLPDSGNIVIQYNTATIDGAVIVNGVKEVAVN